jgi:hypothetical protein
MLGYKYFRIGYSLNIVLFSLSMFITINSLLNASILIFDYLYFSIFISSLVCLHLLVFKFTKSCYCLVFKNKNENEKIDTKKLQLVPILFSLYSILLTAYSVYLIWHVYFSNSFINANQKLGAQLFLFTGFVSLYVSVYYWIIRSKKIRL